MSGSEPGAGDVFDIAKVRALVKLMKEYDLSEINLRQEDQRIQIRRGNEPGVTHYVASPGMVSASPAPAASGAGAASPSAPAAPAEDGKNIVLIKSPMVGTFYNRPNPDSETFVKVGDHISAEKTVCIIEAMKVFNEIPAEVTGKVVAVLVDNEEPVDFGRPLFKIDTSK